MLLYLLLINPTQSFHNITIAVSSLNVAGTIFTIVFAMPLFIAVILPLAVVYYLVQKVYVATARQVRMTIIDINDTLSMRRKLQ